MMFRTINYLLLGVGCARAYLILLRRTICGFCLECEWERRPYTFMICNAGKLVKFRANIRGLRCYACASLYMHVCLCVYNIYTILKRCYKFMNGFALELEPRCKNIFVAYFHYHKILLKFMINGNDIARAVCVYFLFLFIYTHSGGAPSRIFTIRATTRCLLIKHTCTTIYMYEYVYVPCKYTFYLPHMQNCKKNCYMCVCVHFTVCVFWWWCICKRIPRLRTYSFMAFMCQQRKVYVFFHLSCAHTHVNIQQHFKWNFKFNCTFFCICSKYV